MARAQLNQTNMPGYVTVSCIEHLSKFSTACGLFCTCLQLALPHGMFLPWIGAELAMHEQSVRRFMQVAERFGKSNTVLDLPLTALYELAAPSTT